jgi:hypothetical protein
LHVGAKQITLRLHRDHKRQEHPRAVSQAGQGRPTFFSFHPETGDGKPIGNAEAVFKDLVAELKVQTDRLQQVVTRDLAAFNAEAKRLNLDPVTEKSQ